MSVTILEGDCVEVMRGMDSASVDAIVTDPPYELGFMGKKWDASGIAYSVPMWSEAWRVLKPGGHLLAFGGTRTYHRMACAIEDAGFEIRDCLQWLYGSGFPKSLDVSKAIDKAAGATREVVGPNTTRHGGGLGVLHGGGIGAAVGNRTAPATPEAQQWSGFGTALKPANEPIVLARKPLAEKTVAANVLAWGTGALNIDAGRIGNSKDTPASVSDSRDKYGAYSGRSSESSGMDPNVGRWPANVLLDETAAELLDEQSGQEVSRFFYVAKASRKERNAGLEDMPEINAKPFGGGMASLSDPRMSRPQERQARHNTHPTVKPIALMRYLIRLVTPPGGTVLDPFAGSGTTGLAALSEGFAAVLIEREPEYAAIARARVLAHS